EYHGAQLARLLKLVNEYLTIHTKLNRRLDNSELLDRLLLSIAGEGGFLRTGFSLKQIFETEDLLKVLGDVTAKIGYKYTILADEEHGLRSLVLERANTDQKLTINWDLLSSAEWQRLFHLYAEIAPFEKPPFVVRENGDSITVSTRDDLLNYIVSLG